MLGEHPVETELLVRQARLFLEQGQFEQAVQASDRAGEILLTQTTLLTNELGRYADDDLIAAWRESAQRTIDWSKSHRAQSIVISKADRVLSLYRMVERFDLSDSTGFEGNSSQAALWRRCDPGRRISHPSQARIWTNTLLPRLLLDYPNADDRRRFEEAQSRGNSPKQPMPGLIQLHGTAKASRTNRSEASSSTTLTWPSYLIRCQSARRSRSWAHWNPTIRFLWYWST